MNNDVFGKWSITDHLIFVILRFALDDGRFELLRIHYMIFNGDHGHGFFRGF